MRQPKIDTRLTQIGHHRIQTSASIKICSGEGEQGVNEEYAGPRSIPGLIHALAASRCNGDRWAYAILDWPDYGPVTAV